MKCGDKSLYFWLSLCTQVVEVSLKASKSFVIDADVVKTYDVARDFFTTLGYSEQSAIRPTLLVLKRRGSLQGPFTSKTEDYRISLRVSFNPVGDLQLYSATLLTIRCDYDVKVSGGVAASSDRATLESEVERLRCHLISNKIIHAPSVTSSTPRSVTKSPEPKIFNVSEAVVSGRITTGYKDLDDLLLGGIPENYAVVMTSPSSDERELLIKKFLEAGAKAGQITFYIAVEPGNGRALAEKFQSNFYLFVCNPRADVMIKSLPNVFKLKGVESLTDIDITLIKAYRTLDALRSGPRRACIEIISDVLLQHHAVVTRKWLSGILPDLRSKGFTTLAVVNPHMHPQEEVQAILGLFEGEIKISEKETEKGIGKILRIRKLYNQRYSENELTLTRERLES
jgi:KaiC/GvpD/RAD55 family RecA-like ATPase